MTTEQRLTQLERQLNGFRWLVFMLVAVCMGLVAMRPSGAQPTEDGTTLNAPVKVVNKQGNVIATIGDRGNSGGQFHLHAPHYPFRVGMEASGYTGKVYYVTTRTGKQELGD